MIKKKNVEKISKLQNWIDVPFILFAHSNKTAVFLLNVIA